MNREVSKTSGSEGWLIRGDTTYLNHGSFGVLHRTVRERQLEIQAAQSEQPMDFFVRHYEPAWFAARDRLAEEMGTTAANLAFTENSTDAMNTVANSFPLEAGDEVLLTDHEYGAVERIWQRACKKAGCPPPCIANLQTPLETREQVVENVFSGATERTRLLVVSHITSPTAIVLPVQELSREARRRGIAVCIDGPHAPAQVPVALDALDCDFYAASLHKWVSAPLGSGFLFVAPQWHDRVVTPQLSWGRLLPAEPEEWWEQFVWPGTRDFSAWLSVPAAFDVFADLGYEGFREQTHRLAREARHRLVELVGLEPLVPDECEWYGSMASVPLPAGDAAWLQNELWRRFQIEIPIVEHNGHRSIRVSCHLYTTTEHIDRLVSAVGELLQEESRR